MEQIQNHQGTWIKAEDAQTQQQSVNDEMQKRIEALTQENTRLKAELAAVRAASAQPSH